MVQAFMAGRKTETRMMRGLDEINQDPDEWKFDFFFDDIACLMKKGLTSASREDGTLFSVKCPFELGPAWIRETWVKCGIWDGEGPDPSSYRAIGEPLPESMRPRYWFKADNPDFEWDGKEGPEPIKWKPSIHMPFAAARNFIYIDEIRLERLQDITEEGAIAEGIECTGQVMGAKQWKGYLPDIPDAGGWPVTSFFTLITSINGPECWEKNYWTWVLKFHKIEKPN